MKTYPLNNSGGWLPHKIERQYPGGKVKAVRTGEFRRPLKGELYLSGAIPAAYEATSDLQTAYAIMKLVYVREVVTEVVEELPG